MSVDWLEKALWDLNVDRAAKQSFREDAGRFCGRYRLAEDEAEMLATFDVKGLVDKGVNPMLTMGYWLELEGSRSLGGYVARLRGAARSAEARS
ncbi:MAG TPA: hypothetical protein VHB02_15675 [Acidimicrobiales bacterium]|nr:hypothetical protein [Acidimicrobiales bacterium]